MTIDDAAGTETPERTFSIEVQRLAWGNRTFEISARSLQDAQEKALDVAGNHVFSEKDSSYEVVNALAPEKQAVGRGHKMDLMLEVETQDDYYFAVLGVTWAADDVSLAQLEADAKLCAAEGFSEVRRPFYEHTSLYREDSSLGLILNLPELCVGKTHFWIEAKAEDKVCSHPVDLRRLRAAFDAGVQLYVHAASASPQEFLESVGLQERVEGAVMGVTAVLVGPEGEVTQDEFDESCQAPIERGQ